MPVAAEDDGNHGLCEKDEGDDDREQERAATPDEETQEVPRCERIQGDRQDGAEPQRWRDLVGRCLRHEPWDPENRCRAPRRQGRQQDAAQEPRVTEDELAARPAER